MVNSWNVKEIMELSYSGSKRISWTVSDQIFLAAALMASTSQIRSNLVHTSSETSQAVNVDMSVHCRIRTDKFLVNNEPKIEENNQHCLHIGL